MGKACKAPRKKDLRAPSEAAGPAVETAVAHEMSGASGSPVFVKETPVKPL